MLTRRKFLQVSVSAVAGLSLAGVVGLPRRSFGQTNRPNIVWISVEDLSPRLGCYGDPIAQSPNIDQLAREGMRFTRAFTPAGVCAPCRSAIITGMYQNSIGTHHMRTTH
ncbi:MAG TPA: sulfatase-like hydrolase/transferase, partial [bacterium]|nr:sulfatase-like hydrolase/transferase [bacterium]